MDEWNETMRRLQRRNLTKKLIEALAFIALTAFCVSILFAIK